MTNKAAIICTVERLYAYDTANTVFFGLNVVPAMTEVESVLADFLRTWLWNSISDVQVALFKDADPAVIKSMTVVTDPAGAVDISPVVEKLQAKFESIKQNTQNFVWDRLAPEENGDVQPEPNDSDPTSKFKWHQLLAHASTYPAPVPGILNLNCILKLQMKPQDLAGFDSLILIPKISFKIADSGADVSLVAGAVPVVGDAQIWPYVITTTQADYLLEVKAHQEPFDLTRTPQIGLFDERTLWFNANGIPEQEPTNWLARFEGLLASKFDLAQQLLDAVPPENEDEEEEGTDQEIDEEARQRLLVQEAIIHSLNDQIGTAHLPTPGGLSFIAQLLNHLAKPLNTSQIRSIEGDLEAYQRSIDITTLRERWTETISNSACAAALPVALEAPPPEKEKQIPKTQWKRSIRDLLAIFSDEQVKKRLLFDTWSEALAGNAAWKNCQEEVRNSLLEYDSAELPVVALKAGISNSVLGVLWLQITKVPSNPVSGNGKSELRTAIKNALLTYFLGRFSLDAGAGAICNVFYPHYTLTADVADIKTKLEKRFEKMALEIVPPDAPVQMPTKMPEGISFQIASTFSDSENDKLSRSLAGVGVLMRRKNADWKALNVAKVKSGGKVLCEQSSVPIRLNYQNEMLRSVFTYDGHPLIAKSHAAALQDRFEVSEQDESSTLEESIFDFDVVSAGNWSLNPALVFGETYEIALHGITNSGVIPQVLSDGHPSKLSANQPANPVPPAAIRTMQYLRTTSVGVPRFQASEDEIPDTDESNVEGGKPNSPFELGQMYEKALTKFPAEVVPLAHDLELDQSPLILMWNKSAEYKFSVTAPATDIYSWDRFVAGDAAMMDTRICVWADVHRKMNEEDENAPNIHLQDPSVETLRFVVKRLFPKVSEPYSHDFDCKTTPYTRPAGQQKFPEGEGLKAANGPSAQVKLVMKTDDAPDETVNPISASGNAIDIEISKGEIWELTIASLVLKGARSKFAKFSGLSPFGETDDNGDFLVSPLKFVIESATEKMPNGEAVYESFGIEENEKGARVLIDASRTTTKDGFEYIKQVEVKRQCWRWDGMAMDQYPFSSVAGGLDPSTASPAATDAMNWESTAFYNRSQDDASRHFKAVNLATLPKEDGTIPVAPPVEVFQEITTNDRRALHFRYSLRVKSRYAGLPGLVTKTIQSKIQLDPAEKSFCVWKRFYTPYTGAEERISKPAVKFILPLTENRSDKVPATGFLAICNEEWYQAGGLGEQMIMQICKTERNITKEEKDDPMFFEAGPDPIITGKAEPITRYESKADGSQEILGEPRGCTFDTDTNSPLFVNTAVYFDAPNLYEGWDAKSKMIENSGWYFLKVQFKRAISGESTQSGKRIESELTSASWIQLLQQASLFQEEKTNEKDPLVFHRAGDLLLSLKQSAGDKFLGVFANNSSLTKLSPTNSDGDLFSLWLMVTRTITDAFGRKNNEKFISIIPYANGKCEGAEMSKIFNSAYEYKGRIVEIQSLPGVSAKSTKEFFNLIFIADKEKDATARIVRVSEPFAISLD